ncbi:MAG: two-component regulator propeller domain-containing protein, partial [Actinomycetota bacterium]
DREGATLETVSAIIERSDGTLCFAAGDLACLENGSFRAHRAFEHLPGRSPVQFLAEDGDGGLWLGTHGLGILELRDGTFRRWTAAEGLPAGALLGLAMDATGSLWAAAAEGGVGRFRDGRWERLDAEGGLSGDQAKTIFEDREGNVWIGTNGDGLNRLADRKVTPYSAPEGLSHPFVHAVLEDRAGTVWIGTNGGLHRLRDGTVTAPGADEGLPPLEILSLWEDRGGTLWVGTATGGVFALRSGRFHRIPAPSPVLSLYEDREGNLFGRNPRGIAVLRDGRFETVPETQEAGAVPAIAGDPARGLWLGTVGMGLVRYAGGALILPDEEGRPAADEIVTSLHVDAAGTLWATSYGGGLLRRSDRRFTRFTARDGLPSDNLYQVLEDDHGFLWVSSNHGVFRIAKAQLDERASGRTERLEIATFGTADGMRSEECNGGQQPAGWKGRDGRLWFPTVDGVAMIDPARLGTNPHPPPVHVERVVVDDALLDYAMAVIEETRRHPQIAVGVSTRGALGWY